MQEVQIIDRGRGPEIAGTRITVYHIWEFVRAGDAPDDIALTFGLSSRQVRAAIEYIKTHREEVQHEYAKIEQRIQESPPAWVEDQLSHNRKKLQAILQEKKNQHA